MNSRIYSWSEARDSGLVVHFQHVLDIRRFKQKHKGGAFLHHLRGKNVSLLLFNAHHKNAAFAEHLGPLQVGKVDRSTLPEIDLDAEALLVECQREGLFNYRASWLLFDALKLGLPLALALALLPSFPFLSFIALTIHVLAACWWVHDVAHNSVFRTEKTSRFFTALGSILFTGTYAVDYHYVAHRLHHGFTNTIGLDGALSTGPIHWHPSQETELSRRLHPFRAVLWLGPLLGMIFPIQFMLGLYFSLKKRKPLIVAALVIRWYIFAELMFPGHWAVLLGSTFAGAYLLGLISSLNHFHLQIGERFHGPFLAQVARSTQNMHGGGWPWTEATGGLNYHIEHHIFPTMPRHNYPRIQPRVRALFAKHGLPYHTCGIAASFRAFFQALNGAPQPIERTIP